MSKNYQVLAKKLLILLVLTMLNRLLIVRHGCGLLLKILSRLIKQHLKT